MTSALELFQLATSSGVLALGLGVLKWSFSIEKRLLKLEIINTVKGNSYDKKTHTTA